MVQLFCLLLSSPTTQSSFEKIMSQCVNWRVMHSLTRIQHYQKYNLRSFQSKTLTNIQLFKLALKVSKSRGLCLVKSLIFLIQQLNCRGNHFQLVFRSIFLCALIKLIKNTFSFSSAVRVLFSCLLLMGIIIQPVSIFR